jgi:CheY-like chemotaxis protein
MSAKPRTAGESIKILLAMGAGANWIVEELFTSDDMEIAEITGSGERCLGLLENGQFDVLILGPTLLDISAIDVLRYLNRSIPTIVVVLDEISPDLIMEMLNEGATDLLVAPTSRQLITAIRSAVSGGNTADHEGNPANNTTTRQDSNHYTADTKSIGGKLLCVYNCSGEISSHLFTMALAGYLQDKGMTTALLDMSDLGHQAVLLGVADQVDHANWGLLASGRTPNEVVLHPEHTARYFVATPTRPEDLEAVPMPRLHDLIDHLRRRTRAVVVDMGPYPSQRVMDVMSGADRLFITSKKDTMGLRRLNMINKFAQQTRKPIIQILLEDKETQPHGRQLEDNMFSLPPFSNTNSYKILDEPLRRIFEKIVTHLD